MNEKVEKTDQEWKADLTPEQYRVLREKGTERAFTGRYHATKEPGTYRCAGCGAEVFSSETKYESGTCWPSFWKPTSDDAVETERDWSLLGARTETHADTVRLCRVCERRACLRCPVARAAKEKRDRAGRP